MLVMLFAAQVYADDLFHTGSCNVPRVESPTQPTFQPIIVPRAGNYVGQTIYNYYCPRCGLMQTYTMAGIHRCPNDGSMMILR